jgi:hypothetical protein
MTRYTHPHLDSTRKLLYENLRNSHTRFMGDVGILNN